MTATMPSADVKDILEAESSLALTFATDLFIGREPAKPNVCVTIYDTGGPGALLTLDRNEYQRPSVQIRVRHIDYTEGWNLMEDIRTLLHGKSHETWNGTRYEVFLASGGVGLLGWDENHRVQFTINFEIQRR